MSEPVPIGKTGYTKPFKELRPQKKPVPMQLAEEHQGKKPSMSG
jgi:hypothetical protein